ICTANTVDTIPSALLDRMDVIQLSGYTEEEKLGIAERYLVPRQITEHGLERDRIEIGEAVLRLLAREYTREAGVRGLARRIGDVCRKAAVQVARVARAAPLLGGDPAAHGRPRRRYRARVHAGRRRRPLHRGAGVRRPGQAHGDGPARRGDAGVRAGGAL